MIPEDTSSPELNERAAAPDTRAADAPGADAERVRPYVPRTFQQHLVDAPESPSWISEGTAVFVDISGFTQLSEQLARKGREGAEQITDVISSSFEAILAVAYQNGGGLTKFGGDSLLLWFHGDEHTERACRASVLMRRVLDDVGRIELPDAKVTLQMSQGVHSGSFHFFSVGTSHLELLPVGPAWSRLASLEHEASAGEILISDDTANRLPAECRGGERRARRVVSRLRRRRQRWQAHSHRRRTQGHRQRRRAHAARAYEDRRDRSAAAGPHRRASRRGVRRRYRTEVSTYLHRDG